MEVAVEGDNLTMRSSFCVLRGGINTSVLVRLSTEYEEKLVKILHFADWDLRRQFHNVPLVEDQVYFIDQFFN